MKIMTFNTQHCQNFRTGKIDFAVMADAIKKCGADIVGLNEMRSLGKDADYKDQTAELSRLTGIENYYFAKAIDVSGPNPYGNALLSKFKILSAENIMIPNPPHNPENSLYETRCILKARLEGGLTVLITHFGLNGDEQENAVLSVLENLENERCILMGDFNLTPESALLDPIRAKMTDASSLFKTPLLSFPSDKPEIKIDYIFVTPDIKVTGADIPEIIVSDHRPHTASIEI